MITDAKLRRVSPNDGAILDGTIPGLYLFPSSVIGRGKWILRFTSPVLQKRRDMGLGNYPEVAIKSARVAAMAARQQIQNGIDPIEQRKVGALNLDVEVPTFEVAARIVHGETKQAFKNPKHADQWINTLEDYVFPYIGNRTVDTLRAVDFAETLRPFWLTKPETGSRVRQRCDKVMS